MGVRKIFFFLMFFGTMQSEPVSLVGKVFLSESKGYFIFSDGTFWKVATVQKRSRGPLEWLCGTELIVPSEYEWKIDECSLGDLFESFAKNRELPFDESHAANQEELKALSHLFIHQPTEKMVFAKPLHPADFLNELYKDAHDRGFALGYATGHDAGYRWAATDRFGATEVH